jgi:hypothetical protein
VIQPTRLLILRSQPQVGVSKDRPRATSSFDTRHFVTVLRMRPERLHIGNFVNSGITSRANSRIERAASS